jgi:hypothetical protein
VFVHLLLSENHGIPKGRIRLIHDWYTEIRDEELCVKCKEMLCSRN